MGTFFNSSLSLGFFVCLFSFDSLRAQRKNLMDLQQSQKEDSARLVQKVDALNREDQANLSSGHPAAAFSDPAHPRRAGVRPKKSRNVAGNPSSDHR